MRISLQLLVLAAGLLNPTEAVIRSDFKTCDQAGFCKRTRALADRAVAAGSQWTTPYTLKNPVFHGGIYTAAVVNQLFPNIQFSLRIQFQQDGVARVLMDEVNGLRQRYNETAMWALQSEPLLATTSSDFKVQLGHDSTSIIYAQGRHELRIDHQALLLTFYRDGQPHIVLNQRGLLNMEHFRIKTVGAEEALVVQDGDTAAVRGEYDGFLSAEDEDTMWEESFNNKRDSKPKGPESLSLDITFPGYEHVYGIPQHASSLSLKQTRGGDGAYTDPYRLYNLDVFEYDADSEMGIYGSIPFMKAHRAGSTVGVFAATASEMWIDITKSSTPKDIFAAWKAQKAQKSASDMGPAAVTATTHWMAESGILDLFIFLGPTSEVIFDQHTALTGKIPLPQLFAVAYHQCRWNYISETDVLEVQGRFDEADIPFDVIWLDIEYADQHKYFIWDRKNFPTPELMQEQLALRGRKLVAIIDPHVKKDSSLYVYTEAVELDILTKNPDGTTDFEGSCWTGNSVWPDWFHPKSWDWWISQFSYEKFAGSTKNLFVWNDMNEPSIFDGPEITMQKDAIHYGGWEHRDVHNVFGMIYQNLTAQGLTIRDKTSQRPFVLTRAFFAGSQRFGAMWTGDNLSTWAHLASTLPTLLTNGISGQTFSGADVGGFFGNPPAEMMIRWYQLGAFFPFFRAHGHIDTKRREPYLFDTATQAIVRDAIRLRYVILTSVYTAFFEASQSGVPILRPQYVVFPLDSPGFAIDDQFYLGSSGLLVKPVVTEGATEAEVYISDDQPYYHHSTHDIYFGASTGGKKVKVPAPLDSITALHRGGSILTRRDLVRRSAILTWKDPITLVVAMDITGTTAEGSIYLDDGESFSNEAGDYVYRGFTIAPESSTSKSLVLASRSLHKTTSTATLATYDPVQNNWSQKIADVVVGKAVILGLAKKPSCIRLNGAATGLAFDWIEGVSATSSRRSGGAGKVASRLTIPDLSALVIQDWEVVLEFAATACSTTPAIDHELPYQPSVDCPAGGFLCKNVGHLSSCIMRSRVNDGLCEPECCDGSDETDGKIDCPNTCAAVGKEYRKIKDAEDKKTRAGAATKREYSVFGLKEKSRLQNEVAKLAAELKVVEGKEKGLKAALDKMESEGADDIERKKDSELYKQVLEMKAAIKSLREERADLHTQVNELSAILSDVSRDFNPNYQDMAVLGASRAYKDWKTANGIDAEAEEDAPTPIVRATEDVLQKLEDVDVLELIDGMSSRVGASRLSSSGNLFKIEDYLPESFKPKFQLYKTALLDVLAQTGIIYPTTVASSAGDSAHPGLAKTRAAHSEASHEIDQVHRKLQDAQKILDKDWGRDWEWKKLDGTCVEKEVGAYKYSLCFFGEVHQTSLTDHSRTSLGSFDSWSTSATPGTDAFYTEQVYNEGQKCWNGPARSAKVELVCDTENALISTIEREKCEYAFVVSSPAVCFDTTATSQSHEEL